MAINKTLEQAFDSQPKMNAAVIEVSVEMKPSKMMESLSKGLMSETIRLFPYAGNQLTNGLTSDDIHKYLKTLTWMRCQHVQGSLSKSFAPYRTLYKRVEVPTLAYQLFLAMGLAFDADYSIRFVPAYSIEGSELLSVDEMVEISNVFTNLRQIGFSTVVGMPKEVDGELDFMALCHVEEVVKGYRKSHPVYGFLASFFAQQELNVVTGTMCRIVYGYDTDYQMFISSLLASMKASD